MNCLQALKQHNASMLHFGFASEMSFGFTRVTSLSLRVTDYVVSQDTVCVHLSYCSM